MVNAIDVLSELVYYKYDINLCGHYNYQSFSEEILFDMICFYICFYIKDSIKHADHLKWLEDCLLKEIIKDLGY